VTIEAVQTARGGHLKIVHIFLLSGITLINQDLFSRAIIIYFSTILAGIAHIAA